MMLRHMGWTEAADLIVKGMEGAINAKTVTYDFERLMEGAPKLPQNSSPKLIKDHTAFYQQRSTLCRGHHCICQSFSLFCGPIVSECLFLAHDTIALKETSVHGKSVLFLLPEVRPLLSRAFLNVEVSVLADTWSPRLACEVLWRK